MTDSPCKKPLGVWWTSDAVHFPILQPDVQEKPIKRSALSAFATLYDLLQFPFTLRGKILMQQI